MKEDKITFSIIILAGFVLLVWMFFQYLKSNYDDYMLETHIASFEERNKDLAKKIEGQYEDYLYYTSDAYLEKYAKGNLGLRLPGEELVVIKENTSEEAYFKIEREARLEFESMDNVDKWYLYFFGDRSVLGADYY